MALALPALLCFVSGLAVVSVGWARRGKLASDLTLRAALSVGFGLGIFSVIFFLSRAFALPSVLAVDLMATSVLLIGVFLLRNRGANAGTFPSPTEILDLPRRLKGTLNAAFGVSLCAALYSAFMRTVAYPHGNGWDAFSIWNLHARFLFLGGAYWRDGFSALIPWSHPDYPLLLPSAIAHFWSYVGHDDARVPAAIGFGFTFSTVALLFSALSILRGRIAAILGGLALLTTPFFVELGTSQYADIPLSFFILATIALLCLHDAGAGTPFASGYRGVLALAGLAGGFAAWTKNEGLLFLCAILVARFAMLFRWTGGRDPAREVLQKRVRDRVLALAIFLAAVAPALLLIAWFKHSIAPPGDLFSDRATSLHKLLDSVRYWAILRWYGKSFLRFGDWLLIPGTLLLPALYFATGAGRSRIARPGVRSSVFALVLTLAGYFAIYVITPYDIYWHLRFSLTRLFMQLWPSAIFLFFLAFASDREGSAPTSATGKTPFRPENVSK
jgi:hypothetical protein